MNLFNINGNIIMAQSSQKAIAAYLSKLNSIPVSIVCKPVRDRYITLH